MAVDISTLKNLISLSVLFEDTVNLYYQTASVADEWMSMEQWWIDTDRGKLN